MTGVDKPPVNPGHPGDLLAALRHAVEFLEKLKESGAGEAEARAVAEVAKQVIDYWLGVPEARAIFTLRKRIAELENLNVVLHVNNKDHHELTCPICTAQIHSGWKKPK